MSALEADRRGMHGDWPLWALGPEMHADWNWLLARVEDGTMPDLPCRWADAADADRSVIYWLEPNARTRHLVVGYGARILTGPAPKRDTRARMI
jgi:hypothetical protein